MLPAVALSVSVSLALTVSVICALLVAMRQLGWKRGATIRVELADPTWPYRLLPASPGLAAECSCETGENLGRHTSVADFADVPLPPEAFGPTFEERRRKEEERRKRQEAEVLQQIFEDNLSLHQGGIGLRPVAAAAF